MQNEKGEVIGTTTETDENGKYRFDNLGSGKYKVIFEKPAGLTKQVQIQLKMIKMQMVAKLM